MSKLGNTLAMLKILETGRKYTVRELAERIEVTPRMIKQYKNDLERAGIYIDSINGIYGGYVYKHKNNYDVSFSIKDVNIVEKILYKLNEDDQKELEYVLEKLKTIVIYSENNVPQNNDTNEIIRKYNIISRAFKDIVMFNLKPIDLLIYVYVPIELSLSRISKRDHREYTEVQKEFLLGLKNVYENELIPELEKQNVKVLKLDGTQNPLKNVEKVYRYIGYEKD